MPVMSLDSLTLEECFSLLHDADLGRVVYTERALPACTPVRFALDGHTVVFLVDSGSRLAVATDHTVVAFQADYVHPETGFGWTVLVTGDAKPITRFSDQLRASRLHLSRADAELNTEHWVQLTPGIVTGRRLQPSQSSQVDRTRD
ncbi:MAG: pyridoxamine 5'-phosphate oxidase family protein [Actinomycetota bacterium]